MQDMQLGIYSSFAGFNMFLIVRFGLFVSKNIRLNEYRLSVLVVQRHHPDLAKHLRRSDGDSDSRSISFWMT